jgi:hypothetical protein
VTPPALLEKGRTGAHAPSINPALCSLRFSRASQPLCLRSCSQNLMMPIPALLQALWTRRSRRRFVSIFFRQNSVRVVGRRLHLQPCQKQPSRKTARGGGPGKKMSGVPGTSLGCVTQPVIPSSSRACMALFSVLLFPELRILLIRCALSSGDSVSVKQGPRE